MIRWVTYAEQQRDSLPPDARRALEELVRRLGDDPLGCGTFDKRTQLWRAVFAAGLLTYSVEDRWNTVTVLRITWTG